MDTGDFHELLQRYERQSYRAGRVEDLERELSRARSDLSVARHQLEIKTRDLKAAETKVAEWEQHGEHLFKHLTKRMQQLMPRKPDPLDDIPF